jgi:hypothetical protein
LSKAFHDNNEKSQLARTSFGAEFLARKVDRTFVINQTIICIARSRIVDYPGASGNDLCEKNALSQTRWHIYDSA